MTNRRNEIKKKDIASYEVVILFLILQENAENSFSVLSWKNFIPAFLMNLLLTLELKKSGKKDCWRMFLL